MPAELFRNLAETTLASSYTSGGSSISVVSATGFPTAGVFRVRLGNAGKTIFRVDSVSGTTFTGAAEANDANASSGDSVKIVASRAVAERFLQSPEAGNIDAPSGISAADFYGPVWKLTPIVGADWAWRNQGSATVVDANGISFLACPGQTQNMRARMKNISVLTYTALLIPWLSNAASGEVGIGFLESGTGKWQVIRIANDDTVFVSNWTADATISGNQATGPILGRSRWHWLRVQFDNTNVIYSYSLDGVNFIQLRSDLKNAQFTTAPDKVVYFVNDRSTVNPCRVSIMSWSEA